MPEPAEIYARMQDFMDAGGEVLWLILLLTALLWTLIFERYWYQWWRHPQRLEDTVKAWRARRDKDSWYAHSIREAWLTELELHLNRSVGLLKTVIAVLPLVGLLGTVTGMIQVFDVLAVTGTDNPRAMAGGVSAATYPTMAGMVAAISGLYFAARIERRAQAEARIAADQIPFLDDDSRSNEENAHA